MVMSPFLMNPTTYEAGLLAAVQAHGGDVEARKAAFEQFAKTGLPHRRMEAWKWTDLRTALSDVSEADDGADILAPSVFAGSGCFTITLDAEGASWGDQVPTGVTIRVSDNVVDLHDLVADHPMASLAAALSPETLIITVAAHASVSAPIHLRRVAKGGRKGGHGHMRVLLSIDHDADVSILETLEEKDGAFFDNLLTEVRLGERAQLSRTVFSQSGAGGVDNSLFAVALEAEAQFSQYGLLKGGKRARTETRVHFTGEGAIARLFSAAMLSGQTHGDQTSHIIHDAENCVTEQQHKSVLRDRATGVFQGKFLVERSGQKTDANMQANAMLLSDAATVNHKPELEIYADDVECAHGSTSGALDEDAIFYMRQRGLSEEAARSLLVEAFVAEIFDEMPNEQFADIFRNEAAKWLAAGQAS